MKYLFKFKFKCFLQSNIDITYYLIIKNHRLKELDKSINFHAKKIELKNRDLDILLKFSIKYANN